MLGLSEKQMTILTISALVLVLLAGGGAIYYLQFVVIAEKKTEIAGVEQKIAEEQTKVPQMDVFRNAIETAKKKIAAAKGVIPTIDEKEYDSFVDSIDELRRRAGVDVASGRLSLTNRSNPTGGALPGNFYRVDYTLTVTGTFDLLLRFLNILETNDRFVHVQRFAVTPTPDSVSHCSLPLTISSYLFTQPGAPPKPPASKEPSAAVETTPIP